MEHPVLQINHFRYDRRINVSMICIIQIRADTDPFAEGDQKLLGLEEKQFMFPASKTDNMVSQMFRRLFQSFFIIFNGSISHTFFLTFFSH